MPTNLKMDGSICSGVIKTGAVERKGVKGASVRTVAADGSWLWQQWRRWCKDGERVLVRSTCFFSPSIWHGRLIDYFFGMAKLTANQVRKRLFLLGELV